MKKHLLLVIFAILFIVGITNGQTYFHPVSGDQVVTLGPGIYNYYDNGGPGGNYSDGIDGSSITFKPQQGHRIAFSFQQFELEPNPSGGCYDYLQLVESSDCSTFWPAEEYCEFPFNSSRLLCYSQEIIFRFFSDLSVTESGWHIRIEVVRKTPENIVCTDFPCFPSLEYLDCDDIIFEVADTLSGKDRLFGDYQCYDVEPFSDCSGTIDYYPDCDNNYYPGREVVHFLTLEELRTLYLSCECFKEIFAVSEAGCACRKFTKAGNEFTLDNLAPGNYYIIAELECNPDPCSCDFVFQCSTPGPGILDCSSAEPIDCGQIVFSSNSSGDGGVSNVNSYCNPSAGEDWTGREKVYLFEADFNGLVYISLTGLSADLDLIIVNDCDRTNCKAISDNPGFSSEFYPLNVKKGESFYIIVDGWNFAQSSYLLEVQCEMEEDCIECGQCFTYSLVNKGLNTDVVCRSKYVDCEIPNFPTPNHSFRWTVDGVQVSTSQNATLSIPTHKKVTVCQEIRLNSNFVFQCCWEVNAAPGCQSSPVPHWSQTSGPLDYNVVLNASGSQNGNKFYWDFADGSPIVPTSQNPIGQNNYFGNIPERAVCVYVQNDWGLSQYCKTFAPGAFECSGSTSPKFDYTINGNVITITSDNPSGIIKEWELDYGNGVKTNGTNWTNQSLTYTTSGTYEICIRFRVEQGQAFGIPCSFDGCIYFSVKASCCTTILDNCTNLKYNFVSENNGLVYSLSRATNFNQQAIGWEINDVPVANSAQNTIQYLFPSAGVYKICFLYINPTTGCIVKCCRLVWVGNPFNCGTIFFNYEKGSGYQFYTEAEGTNLIWTNDDTGEEIGLGETSNFIPVPGSGGCVEVNISVRYFDPSCNCWRLCCLQIFLCDPAECVQDITVNTQPGPGGSTALCVDNSYNNVRWICLDNNQIIGTDNCVNVTSVNCQVFCVQYYDPVSKCFRLCCRDLSMNIQDPVSLSFAEIQPNPFNEVLSVQVEFLNPVDTRLELIDAQGRIMQTNATEYRQAILHQWQIDTRHLADGLYVLRIITSDGEIVRRLVKVD